MPDETKEKTISEKLEDLLEEMIVEASGKSTEEHLKEAETRARDAVAFLDKNPEMSDLVKSYHHTFLIYLSKLARIHTIELALPPFSEWILGLMGTAFQFGYMEREKKEE